MNFTLQKMIFFILSILVCCIGWSNNDKTINSSNASISDKVETMSEHASLNHSLESGKLQQENNPDLAFIQVVHNSPDPAAASLDAYLDGDLLPTVTGINFRESTEFLVLLAGVDYVIDVVVAGEDLSESFYTQTINLDANENYILVANGVIDPSEFTNGQAFELSLYSGARMQAAESDEIDILVHHGTQDAPAVDISVQGGETLVSNIAYLGFEGYLSVPETDLILEVAPAGTSSAVAAYFLPFASIGGFEGTAVTIIASGFLGQDADASNSFGLWVTTAAGGPMQQLVAIPPDAALTPVQIIHNSPDPTISSIDVYLNGQLLPLLAGINFREATPYLTAPAGIDITIDVTPAGAGLSETYFTQVLNFDEDDNYIIVANGVDSGSEIYEDFYEEFELSIYQGSQFTASESNKIDVLFHHGAADVITIDINEPNEGTLFPGISFSEFQGYEILDVDDYIFNIAPAGSPNTALSFAAPFASMEGYEGTAITVLASGLVTINPNEDNFLGLWIASASGGPLVELSAPDPTGISFIQVIHNSPDPAAASLDAYLDGVLLPTVTGINFREATEFLFLESGVDYTIDVVVAGEDLTESFYTETFNLDAGENYILVANGVIDPTAFETDQAFEFSLYSGAQIAATNDGAVDVLIHHGSPDAPAVDVSIQNVGTIVNSLAYTEFDGYFEVAPMNYVLDISLPGSTTPIQSYQVSEAVLQSLNGASITVLASGFLGDDANETNGFGLWAASPQGGPLFELPIDNLSSVNFDANNFSFFPNPVVSKINLQAQSNIEEVEIYTILGQLVSKYKPNTTNPTLDMQAFVSGVYLMKVSIDGTSKTFQVIKE